MNLYLLIIALMSLSFIGFLLFSLVIPFTKGAPYVVSVPDKAAAMLKLAKVKKGERVADIGSGDGTLVILFAKAGADAYGYEINPFLVWKARMNIKKAGLKNAHIVWKSFWKADLSDFDVFTVYQIGFVMKDLEKKLSNEAKKGARIISNYYKFPTLKPIKMENEVRLYFMK